MAIPSFAKPLLQHWGVSVADISTSEKEESDFVASFGAHKVLIEEKTKFDDPVRLAKRGAVLSKGKIYSSCTPLVHNNRLSGLVGKAARQLESSSERDHDFRLLWFTGTGVQAEAKFHQFIATIYGTTNIYEMNAVHYRRCYFFRNSDFYRYAHIIDGAVAAHIAGSSVSVRLCLNPLSPNHDTLRNSQVTVPFGTEIEDPEALEAQKEAFIVDTDIDRKDEGALLAFLQSKYCTLPLMRFDLGHQSASVSLRDDER